MLFPPWTWNLIIKNAGPTGISLMVIISKVTWKLSAKFTTQSNQLSLPNIPKTIRQCVGDSHARFLSKCETDNFLHILNKQNLAARYTI